MSTPTPRAPRQSKAQTRRMLLDAGVRLLFARGLTGGAQHIPLQEVFAVVEAETGRRITGASVYKRIWDTQDDFHRDLLLTAAAHYPAGEEEPVRKAAHGVLDAADLSSPAARRRALAQVCKVCGDTYMEVLEQSRYWQIWLGIWAITVSTPELDDDRALGPSIAEGHRQAVDAFRDVFSEVTTRLGLRLRAPLTVEQFAVAVCAFAEGLTLKGRFEPDGLRCAPRASAAHEGLGDWSVLGVGMEALVLAFFEDPEHPHDSSPRPPT